MPTNKDIFLSGVKNGFPIGVGYFAVAFSLGIAARDYGFSAFQGFLSSMLAYASAGQYMAYSLYATNTTLIELIILTFIINARYLLMGFALIQRMPSGTSLKDRLLVCTCITDEIFGITIARPAAPTPYYTFGAIVIAVPMWSTGTALGIAIGTILPARVVSALGVALFGMFLAAIIPPARKDHVVGVAVITSFVLSFISTKAPFISNLSTGNRTIILTIAISALFALLFPRSENLGSDKEEIISAD